jgi:mRNA interferase YafQ
MRIVTTTTRYNKDLRRCLSRGNDPEKLQAVFDLLIQDEDLPAACRPHKLRGEYEGLWECHIAPDWLLIYEYPNVEELILRRTGTHADLFR